MRLPTLVITVIGFTVTHVLSTEVLHTIHETSNQHCNKLFSILEEDNYGMIEEVITCEMKHNEKCDKDVTLVNQPFNCL